MKGIQFLALVLIGSLFALTGLRQFFVEPLDSSFTNTVWFVIQVLPLLVILPGVLRGTHRAYFYTVLAASLYFIHGVLEAATHDHRTLALWEVGFAIALIALATAAMQRLKARADRSSTDA